MKRHHRIYHRIFRALAVAALLGGCTGLPAPKVEDPHVFMLDARPAIKSVQAWRDVVLLVSMPRASAGFDTNQMVYLRQPHEMNYFAVNRWADTPARMLAPLLTQTLEQTGSFRAVVQTAGVVPADLRLDTELVRLQQDFGTKPSQVQLTLRAQLIDVAGKRVVAAKVFDDAENVGSDDAYGGVVAANRLVQRVLEQVADFCIRESGRR